MISLLVLTLASACGAAPREVQAPPPPVAEAPAPLDWAMLLPFDTKAVIRIDLARVRRSPYRAEFESFLARLLEGLDDQALRPAFEALFARTDVVLAAFGQADEQGREAFVLLARGGYRPDELERLWADAPEPPRVIEVDGERVWSADSGDLAGAVTQLRPGTLLLADTVRGIERVIARTRMESGAPRWPPSVRTLVEELAIEQATIGLVIRDERPEDGSPPFSLGGRADVDGPLDIEVRMQLRDETSAAMMAGMAGGLLQAFTRGSDGTQSGLAELANLTNIEARGSQVRVRIRADRETTERLVPAFFGRVADELDEDEPSDEPL